MVFSLPFLFTSSVRNLHSAQGRMGDKNSAPISESRFFSSLILCNFLSFYCKGLKNFFSYVYENYVSTLSFIILHSVVYGVQFMCRDRQAFVFLFSKNSSFSSLESTSYNRKSCLLNLLALLWAFCGIVCLWMNANRVTYGEVEERGGTWIDTWKSCPNTVCVKIQIVLFSLIFFFF